MPDLYDDLVRLGLKPEVDFEFNIETDSLMRVRVGGVKKLVAKRFRVTQMRLHVSLIPEPDGVVKLAMVTRAHGIKRPGFWRVVRDESGRPVAEQPLTYSSRPIRARPIAAGKQSNQPPSGSEAAEWTVETTGDLTRMLVSWLIGYDRVNDTDSATFLEILSVHADSPQSVKLDLKTRRLAQRVHDELLCFIDDAIGIPDAVDQAAKLKSRVALLLSDDPLGYSRDQEEPPPGRLPYQ